jgi:hypothetical protein
MTEGVTVRARWFGVLLAQMIAAIYETVGGA